MNEFLRWLLSDRTGGVVFNCFDMWHFFYICVVFAIVSVLVMYLGTQSSRTRRKVTEAVIGCAFAMYILDFFLMPLAYGAIDIEKLPFHACTAMCVLSFLSRHSKRLGKYRVQFAMLGLISNFVYLVYPAGVMWQQIHPLSYRVIQTLLFHGCMTIYGLLVLLYEEASPQPARKMLAVTVGMTLWAMLGNWVYSNAQWQYNWFFVVQDPLGWFDPQIAPFVMPPLNVVLFSLVQWPLFLRWRKRM